jgi:hypothetical protein
LSFNSMSKKQSNSMWLMSFQILLLQFRLRTLFVCLFFVCASRAGMAAKCCEFSIVTFKASKLVGWSSELHNLVPFRRTHVSIWRWQVSWASGTGSSTVILLLLNPAP